MRDPRQEAMRRHPSARSDDEVWAWLDVARDDEALELANHNRPEPGRAPSLLDDLWFGAKVACSIAAAALVIAVLVLYGLTGVTP